MLHDRKHLGPHHYRVCHICKRSRVLGEPAMRRMHAGLEICAAWPTGSRDECVRERLLPPGYPADSALKRQRQRSVAFLSWDCQQGSLASSSAQGSGARRPCGAVQGYAGLEVFAAWTAASGDETAHEGLLLTGYLADIPLKHQPRLWACLFHATVLTFPRSTSHRLLWPALAMPPC
jgi:hypothetical protein